MKIRKETKIGVFAVVSLLLLYWGINFIKGTDLLGRDCVYYAKYEQVGGLKVASSVIIKGLNVGVIQSMNYDAARGNDVVIEMSVKNKYKIPKDSKAKLFTNGIMGGKALEIVLGTSTEYYKSGDTLSSVMDKDLMSTAGSELDAIMLVAKELVAEVMTTLTGVNSLLAENSTSLNTTMNNLASISGSLSEVVDSESDQMKQIISNMNALSKTLSDNSSRVDNIMGNVESLTDSLAKAEFPAAVSNLSSTLDNLNTTLESANSGEGTLGKLISDDKLYDSLTAATSNLAVLLEDLKANPGRYVQFSVFGKKKK